MPYITHRTAIIILNWNGVALTKACLKSLEQQTQQDFDVIVVDNGSTDGSVDWLESQDKLTLIRNPHNLGFARAINQGFEKAIKNHYEYVISLNNDTELDKNWFKKLVAFMDGHSGTGFAQGATKQLHNKKLFDSSGIYLEAGFIPNQRALGNTDPCLDVPVVGPNAAGAIYRCSMLKDVRQPNNDFFDGRFFAYVEDVDFNLRCTLRGYVFSFVPDAVAYHVGSATGNKISKKKMYWGARNMMWLIYKNASRPVFRRSLKMIIRSHVANLQFLWRERRPYFLPYLRGMVWGIMSLVKFYHDRRVNLAKQKIDDNDFLALLVPSNPPVSNPFKRLANFMKLAKL